VIIIIRETITTEQIAKMLESLENYVKVAVDTEREVLAGGGVLHADCEAELLADGSNQDDIWGADWIPDTKQVRFEALINIRPRQGNRSMRIEDEQTRTKVETIIHRYLEAPGE